MSLRAIIEVPAVYCRPTNQLALFVEEPARPSRKFVAMTSVDTYYTLNVIVPSAVSGVLYLLTLVTVLIFFPLMKRPQIFVTILEFSVPDIVIDEDGSKVDGTDVKNWILYAMALLIIPISVGTVYMSFWNVFLVQQETRGECVPNFDCFPMHSGSYIQQTPVDNCSQYFNLENAGNESMLVGNMTTEEVGIAGVAREINYECYRFVFRYAEGIGAAGGILLLTTAFSKIYFALLVQILCGDNYERIRIIFLCTVWVSAFILWLLFVVVNSTFSMFREIVFQTDTDIIQFVLYSINFLAVVIAGYILSAGFVISKL